MDSGAHGASDFLVRLVPLLVLGVLIVPPYVRIFRRIGRSPWWSLLVFVPLGFFILPWIVACSRWDRKDHHGIFG